MAKGNGWEVKTITDNFSKQLKALEFIKDNSVYVGIQEKDSSREDEAPTNAELMFIHTNGSPANNIPPRPVIEPAIKNDKERLSKIMKKAAQCAMDGDFAEATKQLHIAGTRGRDVSKRWFVNPENHWQPNAESTAARKRKKGATVIRPLIDTGELRNSISYFVDTKGGVKK